jgi:hypothetical protein
MYLPYLHSYKAAILPQSYKAALLPQTIKFFKLVGPSELAATFDSNDLAIMFFDSYRRSLGSTDLYLLTYFKSILTH